MTPGTSKPMTISKSHPNRGPHNWLIYDVGDKFLLAHRRLYRGDLYDLGCGDMPFKSFFLQHCEHYIGVDWNSSLHPTVPDIAADLNATLPIPDSAADTVVSISVLEHLREPRIMLSEAHRILRRGGHIILHVPFQWHVHEAPYDFFRFTRFALQDLLEQAGFSEIDIEPTTGFWSMWVLKLNYQLKKLVRGPAAVRIVMQLALAIPWWLNQHLARLLDRVWRGQDETAGYVVTATKAAESGDC